ncbi:hypothetical protein BI330_18455 [Mycobacterium sp. CBMA 623]|nr:hypothetical protein [Mycobacteroides sp. CBMA 326]
MQIGVAAALAAGVLLGSAATAAAEPEPVEPGAPAPAAAPLPPGPPAPPPPSQIGNPLALTGTEQGPGGLPQNMQIVGNANLIGQNATPAAPGSNAPVVTPGTNALNNQYLLPQNLKPAEPGKGEMRGVQPGEENADISGGDYLHRLWSDYQDGQLKGGLLGRRPKDELSQPLPDTAPPPGTRIPGLDSDSQGPAPEHWGPEPTMSPPPPPQVPAPPAPGA